MISRRDWLRSSALAAGALVAGRQALLAASPPSVITVYKDPQCQCCTKWVKHLSANGFVVTVRDVGNMDEVKRTMNVPAKLQSCHTAVVGRYVIEGHVPADVIKKLIAEQAAVVGLAVPGMPMGSPGMEGARVDHYDIIAFERSGTTRVYAKR